MVSTEAIVLATRAKAVPRGRFAGFIAILALLILWQLADAAGMITYTYIPSPVEIVIALGEVLATGAVLAPFGHTLLAVVLAWSIAAVIGVGLGIVMGSVSWVWTWSMSSANVLRTIPAVALVPVALLIFGFAIQAEVLVAAFVAVWPVVISVAVAVRRTHPRLHDVARSFTMGRAASMTKLLLPAAFPAIVVALRLALSLSVILVVLTEMIGVPQGLGYALTSAQQSLRPATMWAYLFVITLTAMGLQFLLVWSARRMMPGLAPQLATGGPR